MKPRSYTLLKQDCKSCGLPSQTQLASHIQRPINKLVGLQFLAVGLHSAQCLTSCFEADLHSLSEPAILNWSCSLQVLHTQLLQSPVHMLIMRQSTPKELWPALFVTKIACSHLWLRTTAWVEFGVLYQTLINGRCQQHPGHQKACPATASERSSRGESGLNSHHCHTFKHWKKLIMELKFQNNKLLIPLLLEK